MVGLQLKLTPSGAAAYAVVLSRLEDAGLRQISRKGHDVVTGRVSADKERHVAAVSGIASVVVIEDQPSAVPAVNTAPA